MSASVGRPAEDARPPFLSQVHTWGDASLLALLLAADFTWLIADKEVNQVSLPLALVWSVFIAWVAFAERRANPDECVVALTTALWCFGNGFWTLSDFAEWQDVAAPNAGSGYDGGGGVPDGAPLTYAGVDFYDIQTLDNLAGACFLVASLVGAAYYAHLRYTPFFMDARRLRGDGLVDEFAVAYVDDRGALFGEDGEDGEDSMRGEARDRDALLRDGRSSSSGVGGSRISESSDPFLGPAFTPNVLRVRSRAEYESLSHFLWIAKDLSWWIAVETEDVAPGALIGCAKAATAFVAAALIAHTADALAVARRDAPPKKNAMLNKKQTSWVSWVTDGEVVTKLAIVFWVLAMTVWSFGDMFHPDPETRIGAEVRLFSLHSSADAEGPDSSRWWAAWSMAVGVFVLAAFWGSEAVAICARGRGDGEAATREAGEPPSSRREGE